MKKDNSFNYNEMVSRNWLFIGNEDQKKIRNTRLMFAGCGLGGNIALLASRVGFTKFLFIDYDQVTYSNLNRQIYYSNSLNKNKTVSLKEIVKSINPSSEVLIYPEKFNKEHLKLVKNYDFIINTLDFNDDFYELNKEGIYNNKTVFIPMNLGFGTLLITINKQIGIPDELSDKKKLKNEIDLISSLYYSKKIELPEYILEKSKKFNKNMPYNPQLGIASNLTASLVISCIIKIITNKKYTPKQILRVDLVELLK